MFAHQPEADGTADCVVMAVSHVLCALSAHQAPSGRRVKQAVGFIGSVSATDPRRSLFEKPFGHGVAGQEQGGKGVWMDRPLGFEAGRFEVGRLLKFEAGRLLKFEVGG